MHDSGDDGMYMVELKPDRHAKMPLFIAKTCNTQTNKRKTHKDIRNAASEQCKRVKPV